MSFTERVETRSIACEAIAAALRRAHAAGRAERQRQDAEICAANCCGSDACEAVQKCRKLIEATP